MENACVFCDRKNFEERLIEENENFWIVATLGQISNGGYVLLIPKRHISCIAAMERKEIRLLEEMKIKICTVLLRKYGILTTTIIEHGIVGQTIEHAHLHFIPKPCDLSDKIHNDFPKSKIECVDSFEDLRQRYARKPQPYLFWRDRSLTYRVCWNPKPPKQYLRIAIAKALGRPERADWRTMDAKLDKKLWTETVRHLKPYFT